MKVMNAEEFKVLPDGTPYLNADRAVCIKGMLHPLLDGEAGAVLEKEDIDKIMFGLHKAHLDATKGDVSMNFGIVTNETGKREVRVSFTRLLSQLQLSPENARIFCECIMQAVNKMDDRPRLILPGQRFDA